MPPPRSIRYEPPPPPGKCRLWHLLKADAHVEQDDGEITILPMWSVFAVLLCAVGLGSWAMAFMLLVVAGVPFGVGFGAAFTASVATLVAWVVLP